MKFDNISTKEKINHWIKESIIECKTSYPLLETRGSVAFDIGANVGGFCVHAHKNFDKIYAFEPVIENYNILCQVLDHMSIKNVEVFNTAVYSESNKVLPLKVYNGNHTKDVTCADFENGDTKYIGQQCETISLKDAILALNLEKIDYLKLDCEGSEYAILENFNDYDKIDVICMEIHQFYGLERKNNLLKMLRNFYHLTDINKKGSHVFATDITEEKENVNNVDKCEKYDNIFMINKNLGGTYVIERPLE
jgi:FkbM family methyltransferase